VLILATSSSNSLPHLAVAVFLVNGVGRMICSMWRRTEEEAINRRTTRAKGDRTGPVFLLTAHLGNLDLAPLICVIMRSSSPRSR
jgi:hypothetical protein